MTVAILGRSKWEWGAGDVIVIRVDDTYYAQPVESDDHNEADEIEITTAKALLTGRGVKLTVVGHAWMKEQRELWTRFQTMERRSA